MYDKFVIIVYFVHMRINTCLLTHCTMDLWFLTCMHTISLVCTCLQTSCHYICMQKSTSPGVWPHAFWLCVDGNVLLSQHLLIVIGSFHYVLSCHSFVICTCDILSNILCPISTAQYGVNNFVGVSYMERLV